MVYRYPIQKRQTICFGSSLVCDITHIQATEDQDNIEQDSKNPVIPPEENDCCGDYVFAVHPTLGHNVGTQDICHRVKIPICKDAIPGM